MGAAHFDAFTQRTWFLIGRTPGNDAVVPGVDRCQWNIRGAGIFAHERRMRTWRMPRGHGVEPIEVTGLRVTAMGRGERHYRAHQFRMPVGQYAGHCSAKTPANQACRVPGAALLRLELGQQQIKHAGARTAVASHARMQHGVAARAQEPRHMLHGFVVGQHARQDQHRMPIAARQCHQPGHGTRKMQLRQRGEHFQRQIAHERVVRE